MRWESFHRAAIQPAMIVPISPAAMIATPIWVVITVAVLMSARANLLVAAAYALVGVLTGPLPGWSPRSSSLP